MPFRFFLENILNSVHTEKKLSEQLEVDEKCFYCLLPC